MEIQVCLRILEFRDELCDLQDSQGKKETWELRSLKFAESKDHKEIQAS
jgi:hypothetical protein